MDVARLLIRQTEVDDASPVVCSGNNEYDGRMGVRISAIFVIMVGSTLGAVLPVLAHRHKGLGVPDWVFFICKYFGSGVIIATAFIHLLAPANEALGIECLSGVISAYPWPEGIALMMIFTMFLFELVAMRFGNFGGHSHSHKHEGLCHSHVHSHDHTNEKRIPGHQHGSSTLPIISSEARRGDSISHDDISKYIATPEPHHHHPGDDHLGHLRDHAENPTDFNWEEKGITPESYAAQMTGIFILEFGVVFHSIFIGLTLAVAGEEFITLYIILVFHQTFEGLGLGARLATVPWSKSRRWTPYVLAAAFGLSAPVAMAVGLGVRNTYQPGSATALIANGVFDAVSAGILIYTGLVELMAHEFMFSPYMQKGPVSRLLGAYLLMCLGAGLMALLGKWA